MLVESAGPAPWGAAQVRGEAGEGADESHLMHGGVKGHEVREPPSCEWLVSLLSQRVNLVLYIATAAGES